MLFWVIPVISYVSAWVDLTTARLVWREGWFGKSRQEVSVHEIVSIENLRGGAIRVGAKNGESISLKGFARPKQLAQAIREASIG